MKNSINLSTKHEPCITFSSICLCRKRKKTQTGKSTFTPNKGVKNLHSDKQNLNIIVCVCLFTHPELSANLKFQMLKLSTNLRNISSVKNCNLEITCNLWIHDCITSIYLRPVAYLSTEEVGNGSIFVKPVKMNLQLLITSKLSSSRKDLYTWCQTTNQKFHPWYNKMI